MSDFEATEPHSAQPTEQPSSQPAEQPSAQPAVAKKESWKYEDPNTEAGRKGLLLSNEIERYCDESLLIDHHYSKKQLRPASYTLRIGPEFVDSKGKRGSLSAKSPSFYIEPNSIAYVSTFESLDLPYYIVARFNLRVKWVYRGILLGTGPQVEPGYRGFLSCPLFNFTDRAIKVTYKEEFATIDFERTSDFCSGKDWAWIRENITRSSDVEKLDEVKTETDRFLLFRQRSYPALELLPDYDVVSSLVQLSNEVKTWRNIGVGILIAFFGLALTLLNFQSNLYRELRSQDARVGDVREVQAQVNSKITTLDSRSGETVEKVRSLESEVDELEHSRCPPGKKCQ